MFRLIWCLPICLAVEAVPPPHTALPLTTLALVAAADDGAALPDNAGLERLAKTDPIAFMKACVRRYEREVKGYNAVLYKQERLGGTLYAPEVIDVKFREDPFSVLLSWRSGARLARKTLYVKGQNNGKLLVKPAGLAAIIGIVEREPNGPEARSSSRYPITEFGIKIGMERTIDAWSKAQKQNALHISYLGIKRIKELGGRPCYILQRNRYLAPEEDGITKYTTYIDQETWLQTGSFLQGVNDSLVASYFFRDVEVNPTFPPGTFTRASLSN